jgi:hypothetical protein
MNKMKHEIDNININSQRESGIMASMAIRHLEEADKSRTEVLVKRIRRTIAAAVLGLVLIGGVLAGSAKVSTGPQSGVSGMMPEVVVRAEMPRLATDTVYVRAVRSVATVAVEGNINQEQE